jgi:hypothetical protein
VAAAEAGGGGDQEDVLELRAISLSCTFCRRHSKRPWSEAEWAIWKPALRATAPESGVPDKMLHFVTHFSGMTAIVGS